MEILGHANGQLEEYFRKRDRARSSQMWHELVFQKNVLQVREFNTMCNVANEEFCECIERLGKVAESCELVRRSDIISAMVMIPDRLVSLTRKLELLPIRGLYGIEDAQHTATKIMEPYAAINVRLERMTAGPAIQAQFHGHQLPGPCSPLTLSETAMFLLYYPELFAGRRIVIVDPAAQGLAVIENLVAEQILVDTPAIKELRTWPVPVLVPVCDLRVKQ